MPSCASHATTGTTFLLAQSFLGDTASETSRQPGKKAGNGIEGREQRVWAFFVGEQSKSPSSSVRLLSLSTFPMPPRRKRARYDRPDPESAPQLDASLSVVAHEASLVRDNALCDSLERRGDDSGGRMVLWQADGVDEDVWVDRCDHAHDMQTSSLMLQSIRYDARLLLSSNPLLSRHRSPSPGSPSASTTGFSDLPSDTEETFQLRPEEREEAERQRLKRRLEDGHRARLESLKRDRESPEDHVNHQVTRLHARFCFSESVLSRASTSLGSPVVTLSRRDIANYAFARLFFLSGLLSLLFPIHPNRLLCRTNLRHRFFPTRKS
jgi:hypothetical protein